MTAGNHVTGDRIPLIPIKGYLLVPLPPTLDDLRATRLLDEVGAYVRKSKVTALIVDLSGVDLLDSFLARSIRDVATMASLMGVESVLSGMSPPIAITLIEMGMGISGVATTRDLDSAIAVLDKRRAEAAAADAFAETPAVASPPAPEPRADAPSGTEPSTPGRPEASNV